ncbi:MULTISPECIES: CopG family transcriptional regulator [unclassified Tolypothrix]|uniref:CopG family transcriptional regulator n=1 Tax=unclassified Tolypothrix TaxID=2649714 RepID=UPI0005EAB3D7|nr:MULTISPECIES: CopG family transcriptional regulator [unclassified Tolypothrix]BAY95561.1 CopG domain protein DNA-binding domain protein [Microchaete diplosiphon NIES-3275]EKE98324.1 ribbon-helix-helix protein, CopG family [Tolypothrix sp. PCC 7601]MBE9084686.1 CopG family transcriptional regulator [Tolypothrix sp. LEGE 11397]UYD30650.1 CopG family transcriptional regulator [Tolypothrix sp. PCC 7712]UYD38518.1 CopG family transcriptional regulator [Tolypothrix sp. PCC 7601]
MTKKRKPLDDALAHEFVYGQKDELKEPEQVITQNQQEPEPQPEPEPKPIALPTPTPQPIKPSIMSQLPPTTPKEATIRLTVDLSESMHRKLSMLAARTGRKKAEIVRFLLDEALKDVED